MANNVRYRKWLTEPGEFLLGVGNIANLNERMNVMMDWDKNLEIIPPVLITPVSTLPTPIYADMKKGERRFSKVDVEKLWHPLYWLPDYLYQLTLRDFGDGEIYPEMDDMHQLRILFALNASGVYKRKTGEWLDVLYLIGIDVDSLEGRHRLRAYLDGGADETLEKFSIDPILKKAKVDPDEISDTVDEIYPDMVVASQNDMLQKLIGVLEALVEEVQNIPFEDAAGPADGGITDDALIEFFDWFWFAVGITETVYLSTHDNIQNIIDEIGEPELYSRAYVLRALKILLGYLNKGVEDMDSEEKKLELADVIKRIPAKYV